MLWVLASFAGLAQAAPSACTAMWGLSGTNLQYWNSATNAWVAVTPATGNALGGSAVDGALYFASQVASPANLNKVDFSASNSSGTLTVTIGSTQIANQTLAYTTTTKVSATYNGGYNYVGATFNRDTANNRMFLYATSGTAASAVGTPSGTTTTLAFLGLLDPASPGTVSWVVIYQTANATTTTYPEWGGSGDIFVDQQTGDFWVITNTNPNRLYKLAVSYTGTTLNSAQVVGTATITGLTGSQAGIAVDPLTGNVFFGNATPNTWGVGQAYTGTTIAPGTAFTTGGADFGNCVEKPDPPTVTKSISPGASVGSTGTATLTLTITNPNKVPIFLMQALTDTFPTNLVVGNTPGATASCFSNGVAATRPTRTTVTAVAGATSFAVNSGSMIPGGSTSGGSCSFSILVSATVANLYANTIPSGSLTTTAGTNTQAVSATFAVRATDFSIVKTQQAGSGTAALSTADLTIKGGQTVTYALTLVNSNSGATATATFTDTVPQLITPVLTISATPTGGGTCSVNSAAVAGRIQITGTFATAPPGSTCTVLIQGLGSSTLATATTTNNNALLTTTFFDFSSTNNSATVTTTVGPSANLTITKNNGTTSVVAGTTMAYTITVANLGPANAPNATVSDPAATGLSCSTVTCAVSAGTAACPASLTMSTLQTPTPGGLVIPTFNANSTLTFRVTCQVTATGQ